MRAKELHGTIQQTRWPLGRCRSAARALLPWAILIVLVVGAAAVLGPSEAWSAEPEVVALVNGEPVTRGELQRLVVDLSKRLPQQREFGVQEPDTKELERLALRKLITRRLILQEAGRREFTVTEQKLDRVVAGIRRRLKNPRRFAAWMKARGLDDKSLGEALRAGMLMTRVREVLVEGVRITDEQVREYYEAHQDDLKTAEEVRVRIIAVKDMAAAQEIVAALKKGEESERLAQERSLESRAAQRGDTRWVNPQTLPAPLQEAVGSLKVGETGGPVQTDDEFLLVRLEERKPVRTMSLTEARSAIEQRLLLAKREEVFQSWITEQEKQSKIEVFLYAGSLPTEAGKHSAISSQLSDSEKDVSTLTE
jgi:peptidyl-prolyl cis-trans isomerase C